MMTLSAPRWFHLYCIYFVFHIDKCIFFSILQDVITLHIIMTFLCSVFFVSSYFISKNEIYIGAPWWYCQHCPLWIIESPHKKCKLIDFQHLTTFFPNLVFHLVIFFIGLHHQYITPSNLHSIKNQNLGFAIHSKGYPNH